MAVLKVPFLTDTFLMHSEVMTAHFMAQVLLELLFKTLAVEHTVPALCDTVGCLQPVTGQSVEVKKGKYVHPSGGFM